MATGNPAEEIRKLIGDLGKIPPELRKALRPALKGAAEPIAADARGRASWSRRIPSAITLSVRLSKRNPGVSIRVRQTRAPHGRPLEGITGATKVRHPVFGHRDRWVIQATKPYLAPAAEAGIEEVLGAAAQAVDQVAREQGFR
ncbi:HK97 gp10 family phage protein [Streptosporangium canum]|uniref:HK97 gp10 family phage protein n=1 Tax=Streptosporangium canum TaxID=324952 RepID=UPI003429EC96